MQEPAPFSQLLECQTSWQVDKVRLPNVYRIAGGKLPAASPHERDAYLFFDQWVGVEMGHLCMQAFSVVLNCCFLGWVWLDSLVCNVMRSSSLKLVHALCLFS